jgi:uncharacterized phage protein (TIGR01671 family)
MIKFRAWSKISKKMIHMEDNSTWFSPNVDTPRYKNQSVSLNTALTCDSFVVMQAIGLKDDNNEGEELFVGDIVTIFGVGDCEVKICPLYGTVFACEGWVDSPYIDHLAEGDIGMKVGNIYSNPELIGDK